ncbi:hypothetical protein F66182_1885 [Fusarium sp. NRRL 66182]|nr:hypothetical protein F66182_1885 [Fusarium sp. NRRL 66182]
MAMSVSRCFVFFLVLATGLVDALTTGLYCISMLGSVKINKIPTSTFTATESVTETKQIIETTKKTVTLDALTTTIVQTTRPVSTLTAQQKTGIATEVIRWVYIKVEMTTSTSTSKTTTTITTVTTSTPTVAAPPNFTNAVDSPEFMAKLKAVGIKKLSTTTSSSLKSSAAAGKAVSSQDYVQEVACLSRVRSTSTKTIKTTKQGGTVYTRRPTQTVTTVSTHEAEFRIVYPADATTTETITSIATRTDTSTIFQTTTFVDTGKYPMQTTHDPRLD